METQEFLKLKLEEARAELEALKAELGQEAGEAVDALEAKIEDVLASIDEELHEEWAEFKEVGLFGWIKANPKATTTIITLALVAVNGVLAVFGLHFGL